MAKIALRFGRNQHLVGIIHEPEGTPVPKAVLLWNTGISHRIGPFRAHYDLSEKLCQLGFTVLRFDLSQMGDSESDGGTLPLQEVFTQDIRDACDILEQRFGLKEIISLGICSGAVDAWYHAIEDERIIGLMMVDGFVYPTLRHRLTYSVARVLSWARWWKLCRKCLQLDRSEAGLIAIDYFDSNYPSLDRAKLGTEALVKRGVELLVLYTGGFQPWYSYRKQFLSMLGSIDFRSHLHLEFWPEVDHLFTMMEDRSRLIRMISLWTQDRFLPAFKAKAAIDQVVAAPQLLSLPVEQTPSPTLTQAPQLAKENLASEPTLPAEPTVGDVAPLEQPKAEALTELEAFILSHMNRLLAPNILDRHSSFFEYGGSSVLAIKLCGLLSEQLGIEVPVVLLYQKLQAASLAAAIVELQQQKPVKAEQSLTIAAQAPVVHDEAIAIIGMACRVPGAETLEEFWTLIEEGKEGLSHWQKSELHPSLPAELREHPAYVASRGTIEAERFDAAFFGISAQQALFLDPQQRVLLETCWQALEDGGWAHRRHEQKIAVYAGVGPQSYLNRNLMAGHALPHSEEETLAILANDKDYVATRLAFHLNLKGPAVSIHTACSTSLVSVIEAAKTLLLGDADLALAGAAAITAPQRSGHLYQEGSIFSRDGHCRPFAQDASGTLFSDGCAVVLMKKLSRALADGDPIHAVLRGYGLSNDGKDKASFAAPSVEGQAQAIRMALEKAGWSGDSVAYVECHGTATPIGDPIEIEALRLGYDTQHASPASCAIGSVKANLGHLTAAAGTIGLIKTVLCLKKGLIPPALHAFPANSALSLSKGPFYIPSGAKPWPKDRPARAGVSSFGVGGTNAHVLLESYQPDSAESTSVTENLDPFFVLKLTTRDAPTMARLKARWSEFLPKQKADWRALLATAQQTRNSLDWQETWVARDQAELLRKLQDPESNGRPRISGKKAIALLFPGQGSQFIGMGRELAAVWPRFSQHYDRLLLSFSQQHGLDLEAALHGKEDSNEPLIQQTEFTQPLIFSLSVALGLCLKELGLSIRAYLGHSLGELSAACVSGLLTEKESIALVAHRAKTMAKAEKGRMLAVRLSAEDIKPWLNDKISLCAQNTKHSSVVGGRTEDIELLEKRWQEAGIASKTLATSHAFHSHLMDPILASFRQGLPTLQTRSITATLYSSVTGAALEEEMWNQDYWTFQLREPVLFAQALQAIALQGPTLFLEVGPGAQLQKFVQDTLQDSGKFPSLALLASKREREVEHFLEAIAQLSSEQHELFGTRNSSRESIPVMPFYGPRYWLEPKAELAQAAQEIPMASPVSPSLKTHDAIEEKLTQQLAALIHREASGIAPDLEWMQLGLDSLLLTQWSLKLQKEWNTSISLQKLQQDWRSLALLAREFRQRGFDAPSASPRPQALPPKAQEAVKQELSDHDLRKMFQDQITILHRQLDLLQSWRGIQAQAKASIQEPEQEKTSEQRENTSPSSPTPFALTVAENQSPEAEPPHLIPALSADLEAPIDAESASPLLLSNAPLAEPLPSEGIQTSDPKPREDFAKWPAFFDRLVHEGDAEILTDQGLVRLPRYRGSFLAIGLDGQPGLFLENPEVPGEYWQVAASAS